MQFFAYCEFVTSATWNRPVSAGKSDDDGAGGSALDVISLGRRVRHLRKAKGMTLDDLGAAVGTVASQLSLIENGKREPKLGLLQSLAKALDVSIDQLLGSEIGRASCRERV